MTDINRFSHSEKAITSRSVNQKGSSKMTKSKSIALRIVSLLTFIGNVVVAYVVMYQKNIQLAKQYFLYITPSPGFFKIWIVIYATLLFVVLHNLWKNAWGKKSLLIFILSNCLFMISSAIWALEYIQWIAISGFVLASVDNATIWFWRVLVDQHINKKQKNKTNQMKQSLISASSLSCQRNSRESMIKKQRNSQYEQGNGYSELELLIVRNVLSFYIGWITVAGTVITGLACVHWWGMSLCTQFIVFWISTPIAATALYLFMALKLKNQYQYCFGYILSVLWGLVGAAIASVQNIKEKNYC